MSASTAIHYPTSILDAVQYPTSDGKPMAETELHLEIMVALIHALKQYFRSDPQVYVGGNMLLYYEEDNPKASCAPDIFFVRGVPKLPPTGRREIYRVWEEGKAPDLVIEVTSKSTKMDDLGVKKLLYAALGVQEYYLFDPLNEYLPQQLMGYLLEKGEYSRMEPSRGRLSSAVAGLEIGVIEGWPRLFDPETDRPLPIPDEEAEARREEAEARREEAEARREEAEARKEEAEARRRAEQALSDLEAEKQEMADEIERLRAELERRNRD